MKDCYWDVTNQIQSNKRKQGTLSVIMQSTPADNARKGVEKERKTTMLTWKFENSEYDHEISQSHTAYKHMAPKQSNQLSHPHQDDCKTRMDIK